MTLETIYIARHGYRANWLPPPHPPNPTGIDSDPPLAPHGVDQARDLAKYINSLPESERPQFILSSPFYRCVETAEPTADILSLKVVIERGVGEWYKRQRGVIPEPANYDDLSKFFKLLSTKEEWDRDVTLGVVPNPIGETQEEIFERASLFWSKFIPTFESRHPNVKNVLIVSHAATKIALSAALLKCESVYNAKDNEGRALRAGTCSLDKFVKDNSEWKMTMNGYCDFLPDGEEMNWDFHSQFEAGSDEDIKSRQAQKKSEEASSRKEANGADPEKYEDFYLTIDLPVSGKSQNFEDSATLESSSSRVNLIRPSSQFQITNINNAHPLVKVSNRKLKLNAESNAESSTKDIINNLSVIDGVIFETGWKKLVGTDLIFDDDGQFVGQVREHLKCNDQVKFSSKENDKSNLADDMESNSKDTKDEKTSFLKKAIHLAKQKESEELKVKP